MTLKQFAQDSIFKCNYVKVRVVKRNPFGIQYYCPFSMVFWENLDNTPFYNKYSSYYVIAISNTPKCLLVDIAMN